MRASLIALLVQSNDGRGGWIGSWSPGIGDPSFAGWLTVIAYLVASWLCLAVFRRMKRTPAGPNGTTSYTEALGPAFLALAGRKRTLLMLPLERRLAALWLAIAALLFLLGINKQLDLQTVVTETGRVLARSGAWYEQRRSFQAAFIVLVVLAGLWGLRCVSLLAQGGMAQLRAVLVGMVFLISFVAVRAASFHHVDSLLGLRLAGFKLNWILELGGIAFIALGAYRVGRRSPSARANRRGARPRAPAPAPTRGARDRPP